MPMDMLGHTTESGIQGQAIKKVTHKVVLQRVVIRGHTRYISER